MGHSDERKRLPLSLMTLLNPMGIQTDLLEEVVQQDDSRTRLHPFVVETKPHIKLKVGSLRMVAFILCSPLFGECALTLYLNSIYFNLR